MKRLFIVASIVSAIAVTSLTAFATTNTSRASEENTPVITAPTSNITNYANLSDYINKVTPDSNKIVSSTSVFSMVTSSANSANGNSIGSYIEKVNPNFNELLSAIKLK